MPLFKISLFFASAQQTDLENKPPIGFMDAFHIIFFFAILFLTLSHARNYEKLLVQPQYKICIKKKKKKKKLVNTTGLIWVK